MRLAYRTRPGIPGPSHKAAIGAVCLAAAAGFYGFTTSLQKAAAIRSPGGEMIQTPDESRPAVAVAATPSLVYAVTDRPADQMAGKPPARTTPVAVAATETAAAAEDVNLISQPANVTTAAPLAVATAPLSVPAPAASDQAAPASAVVEVEPNATTPVIPTP